MQKARQSACWLLHQKWENLPADRMRPLSVFHFSRIIRKSTYPVRDSLMVADTRRRCETFRTTLVGWDSQAFTLGKHPVECISILTREHSENVDLSGNTGTSNFKPMNVNTIKVTFMPCVMCSFCISEMMQGKRPPSFAHPSRSHTHPPIHSFL